MKESNKNVNENQVLENELKRDRMFLGGRVSTHDC